VDASRAQVFEERIRQYWPGLPKHALAPAYAGIRPKISGPADAATDFMIQGPADHGHLGLVNLFGIESPGLTSALAIGEEVLRVLCVTPGPPL
jgi:L-2-hydroxyglutarate oxidase LhgO